MSSTPSPILGLDYGRRRCGLALSDPDHILATPLPTCERGRQDPRQMPRVLQEHLSQLRGTYPFDSIVLGWPDAESDTSRELRDEIRRVAVSLSGLWPLRIAFWDEAYSSVEASRRLQMAPQRVRREKGRIDQLAAQILLQEFLDAGCPFAANADPEVSRPPDENRPPDQDGENTP